MFGFDDLSSVAWGFAGCAIVSVLFPKAFSRINAIAARGVTAARNAIARARNR